LILHNIPAVVKMFMTIMVVVCDDDDDDNDNDDNNKLEGMPLISGSLLPRHGAFSGCGWWNGLQCGR
jgi:hypothetical protein